MALIIICCTNVGFLLLPLGGLFVAGSGGVFMGGAGGCVFRE